MIGIEIVKNGLCECCGEADIEITEFESADSTGWHYKKHFLRCKHEDACNRAYEIGKKKEYGHWGKPDSNGAVTCSQCGAYGWKSWKYCPKCGTVMDRKKEDDERGTNQANDQ